MSEEWRIAPGCEGYEVSNLGAVRRVKPYNSTRVNRPLKPRDNGTGYLSVTVSIKGKARVLYISRLVCEAFNGPPPSDRHHAAHRNGIRSRNDSGNLSWKLPVSNEADKIEHGTYRQGSACARARLTEDVVLTIRRDHAAGITRKELARRHKMSANGIFCIVTRKTWKHVA